MGFRFVNGLFSSVVSLDKATVSDLLRQPGYEYLALVAVDHRAAACRVLGRFPSLLMLRNYVRCVGAEVLDQASCFRIQLCALGSECVVLVEDYLDHTIARGALWDSVFVGEMPGVPWCIAELMDLSIGDVESSDAVLWVLFPPLEDFGMDLFAFASKFVESNAVVLDAGSGTSVESSDGLGSSCEDHSDLSGFCYLELFPVSGREEARGMLGRYPTLDALLAVLCRVYLAGGLDGLSPVVALRRVGLSYHVAVGEDSPEEVLDQLVSLWRLGSRGVVGGAEPPVGRKKFCDVCGFVVVAQDHESRCRVPMDAVVKSSLRRLSWLGDARVLLDVRQVLLAAGLGDEELEVTLQRYTERTAQARWLQSCGLPLTVNPTASTDKAMATAFEANYFGKFRRAYLDYLVSQFPGLVLPETLKHMYEDDRRLVLGVESVRDERVVPFTGVASGEGFAYLIRKGGEMVFRETEDNEDWLADLCGDVMRRVWKGSVMCYTVYGEYTRWWDHRQESCELKVVPSDRQPEYDEYDVVWCGEAALMVVDGHCSVVVGDTVVGGTRALWQLPARAKFKLRVHGHGQFRLAPLRAVRGLWQGTVYGMKMGSLLERSVRRADVFVQKTPVGEVHGVNAVVQVAETVLLTEPWPEPERVGVPGYVKVRSVLRDCRDADIELGVQASDVSASTALLISDIRVRERVGSRLLMMGEVGMGRLSVVAFAPDVVMGLYARKVPRGTVDDVSWVVRRGVLATVAL